MFLAILFVYSFNASVRSIEGVCEGDWCDMNMDVSDHDWLIEMNNLVNNTQLDDVQDCCRD